MVVQRVIAVYPGSFDPITNGHVDIIRRAARLVDKLIVAVAINPGKDALFSLEERRELLDAEIAANNRDLAAKVEVRGFEGLLMRFARSVGASVVVRGLRAVSDFEYEFQMTGMNARLDPEIETVFLMASEKHQFIASRLVKEVASLGGDVAPFVSPMVAARLKARFAGRAGGRKRSRL